MRRLPLFAAALWWGSLTTLGFLVVPLLFVHLPTPAMAGGMAAKLFAAQTWVSVVCGMLLLMVFRSDKYPALINTAQTAMIFVVGGMLLALLVEFAVAPRIVAREYLKLWHAVGSGMYVLQWLCVGVVLWHMTRPDDR